MKSESENMKENINSQNTKEGNTGSSQSRILTIPNLLSFFRLCLIPVFMWLYCVEKNYLWTGIILILSGLTDTVDGIIARKFNMISDLGKVLDPIADKLTQAAMLFCLLTRFPLMIAPLALMVVKEFFMGVTGLLVIRKTGEVFGADWHGKVNTWLLYAMMILHVFWYNIPDTVSRVLIGICVIMMLISLVLYGRHNLKALKETEPEK
ncbi:MAG TPA: CDP-alcohol phosphatidyltransferase family protein [Candidatus Mediterraneibacter surreyensis]|uniref:CDP-diacylglycerol--glycerol-3-phosphate 3-phosphatidyltransferase n=1 Tax=Candidatus Mediterraneibacter faecavium TaxID=2838668 RepID=A0A9D2TMK1_9FIRM|nr:CDP-alcohol phosphatidyltransferase family protein [Candidatus Mediterraneibacter surreyensis]HJC74278.1 CDP-alcohol phosphatidyltransferase family protein [Candidatus Mediterraneibacter faecavium]